MPADLLSALLVVLPAGLVGGQAAGAAPVPPLQPLRVVHPWSSVGRYAAGDRGVDLEGAPGQGVVSATAGVVGFAGPVAGRGVVSVTLADGRRLTYEPVVVGVSRGARVGPGSPLGRLAPGWPGCPAAACLHWGLASGHGATLAYADPLSVLAPVRVRLLPLDDAPVAGLGGPGAPTGAPAAPATLPQRSSVVVSPAVLGTAAGTAGGGAAVGAGAVLRVRRRRAAAPRDGPPAP